VPRKDLPTKEVCRRVLAARQAGCDGVIFSGGEPSGRPDLLTLARFVSRTGLKLGLISNGLRLADPRLRALLSEIGLEYVRISLHGSGPAVHDRLSGVSSFAAAATAIRGFAATPVELGVSTVVCRPNLNDLEQTVEVVSELLARPAHLPRPRHRLALLEPKGRAARRPDLWPGLAEAARAVEGALRSGQDRFGSGIERGYDGLPQCLAPVGGVLVDDLAAQRVTLVQEVDETGFSLSDAGRRAYGDPCRGCLDKGHCPGVYEGYFPLKEGTLRPRRG